MFTRDVLRVRIVTIVLLPAHLRKPRVGANGDDAAVRNHHVGRPARPVPWLLRCSPARAR